MLSFIISTAIFTVSFAGVGFLFFLFVKAVAEEHAYNKQSKQLRRQFYGEI